MLRGLKFGSRKTRKIKQLDIYFKCSFFLYEQSAFKVITCIFRVYDLLLINSDHIYIIVFTVILQYVGHFHFYANIIAFYNIRSEALTLKVLLIEGAVLFDGHALRRCEDLLEALDSQCLIQVPFIFVITSLRGRLHCNRLHVTRDNNINIHYSDNKKCHSHVLQLVRILQVNWVYLSSTFLTHSK